MEIVLNEKKDKRTIVFEYVYYIYFSLVLFLQFMATTMVDISKYRTIIKFIVLFLGIILVFKIALEWTSSWSSKAILIGIIFANGFLLPDLNYVQDINIAICLLILASRNISSKRLLWLYTIISTVLTAFVIIYCLTGHVINFVVYRDAYSTQKRYALGFNYTTYLSAHIMGICAAWAYVRGKAYSWIEAIITIIIGIVTYRITDARITCAVIIAVSIIMIINKICIKRQIKLSLLRNRIIKFIMVNAVSLVTVFSIITALMYKSGITWVRKLDIALSGRIKMSAVALGRYSLSGWGQRVTDIAGHNNLEKGVDESFFLINNSYVYLLIRWGIFALITVVFCWTLLSYRVAKRSEYYKLFILDTLTVYAFFEQRMMFLCIIPFWILLVSDSDVVFFDLSKFKINNLLKKYSKKIWLILSMSVLAFAVDLVVYNNKAVMNIMNEAVDLKDTSVVVNGLVTDVDDRYRIDYENLDENEEAGFMLANIFSPIGIESFSLGINFYEYSDDHYRYLENVQYSYDIYSMGDEGKFIKVKTVKCNSSKHSTWFTDLDINSPAASLFIVLHFDKDYLFDIKSCDINGPVPYDFNPGRLALIWLILSALALVLSSGKKPEDKENDGEEEQAKEDTVENTEAEASEVETEVGAAAEKV